MKAVTFFGKLEVKDIPEPVRSDEVRVQVVQAGICNTDLEIVRGYMDFQGILGHEFVGRISKGSKKWTQGQRVVADINCACGKCDSCLRGLRRHCPSRTTLGIFRRDGAMAKFVWLPEEQLYAVPDTVSDEQAVFAEPLAAALEVLEQLHVLPEHQVAILGDGKLALLLLQVLKLTGCRLTLFGRHEDDLHRHFHKGLRYLPSEEENIRKERKSFDIVIEATGNPYALSTGLELVRPRGTLVMKSTYVEKVEMDVTGLVVDEITLIGSRCGSIPAAVRMLESGLIETDAMIEARYPIQEGKKAFRHAQIKGCLKVVLEMEH